MSADSPTGSSSPSQADASRMADATFVYNTSNFDEPEPLSNHRGTILGIGLTFMVRLPEPQHFTRSPLTKARLGHFLDMCAIETLHPLFHRTVSGMG